MGSWSYYLWQPTIIGSQCQLVHSDWLPSVLQTEDQQRRTDDFVYIISAIEWKTGPIEVTDTATFGSSLK